MIAARPNVRAWIVGSLVLAAMVWGGCAAAPEPRTCIEPTYSYLRQPMASAEHSDTSDRIGSDQPDSGDGFRY